MASKTKGDVRAALAELNDRIVVGVQEFPDACSDVAQLYSVDHDALRDEYDRQFEQIRRRAA